MHAPIQPPPARDKLLFTPGPLTTSAAVKQAMLHDAGSWHFYRLAFVGYDLTVAEFLRAMAYGTKTTIQVQKRKALFSQIAPQR